MSESVFIKFPVNFEGFLRTSFFTEQHVCLLHIIIQILFHFQVSDLKKLEAAVALDG